ncbi:MAG: type II CAAX endopeptidase family protein [Pseudomonadota bacterium]
MLLKNPNFGDDGHPSRGEQTMEVSVFLFLIIPSMAFSFFAIREGSMTFRLVAVSAILRDLSLVALILFFLWRNRESLSLIGLTSGKFWREAGLGAALFLPVSILVSLLQMVFRATGLEAPSTPLPAFLAAEGIAEFILATLLVIVVAISEEIIFRGYLILRFGSITRDPSLSVVLSAAIFSLGHGYEGSAGVATVGFLGAILALIYLWRGSLVAPIVMHFLQNFVGIVILPLLKG